MKKNEKPVMVQLFKSRSRLDSCKVGFEEVMAFYKGTNNDLLKKVDYESYDKDLVDWAIKTLSYDPKQLDTHKELIFTFYKGRKNIYEYVCDGVYKLSKEKLSLNDFNTIKYNKLETIIKTFNKGLYDLVKGLLPCYTMSYFKTNDKRKIENVIGHSGYIRFDIDNVLSDVDVDNLKKLKPYAIVPSTSGIPSPIFKIEVGDKILKKFNNISKLHESYFKYFEKKLADINIIVDTGCKNINRLFYISVNKDFKYYYLDEDAHTYELDSLDIDLIKNDIKNEKVNRENYISGLFDYIDKDDIKSIILKEVKDILLLCKMNNIQPFYDGSGMRNTLRNFYFSLGGYINEEDMEGILCDFLLLTEHDERITDDKYKERDIEYLRTNVFTDRNFSKEGGAWKYIFNFIKTAKEYIAAKRNEKEREEKMDQIEKQIKLLPESNILLKYINDTTPIQTIRNLYHFLTLETHKEGFYLNNIGEVKEFHKGFLKIEKNILTDMYIVNDADIDSFDFLGNSIKINLEGQKTSAKQAPKKTITFSMKDYLESWAVPKINPIVDYFKKLDIDNNDDMILKVLNIFDDCSDNRSGRYFVDWCYGVVKNALDPNYYDRILYFYAPNGGEGKTWFIQNDLIPDLADYISSDFNFNTENKDDKFKMAENLILLDDEGGKTSKRQDEIKKAVSSKKKIKERVSFGKTKSNKKRIASIVVATNSPEVSSASNTDRRSMVVALKEVKYSDPASFVQRWRREVVVNKFWAQMYSLYLRDNNFRFVEDEEILDATKKWSQISVGTELVEKYLRPEKKGENPAIITHVELKELLETVSGKRIDTSLLGILKKNGFRQIVDRQKCPFTGKWKTGFKIMFNTPEIRDEYKKNTLFEKETNMLGSFISFDKAIEKN